MSGTLDANTAYVRARKIGATSPLPAREHQITGEFVPTGNDHSTGSGWIGSGRISGGPRVGSGVAGLSRLDGLDTELIQRARTIVEGFDNTDELQRQLCLDSLATIVTNLWESAVGASRWHKDILAALESGVRQVRHLGCASPEQLEAFREVLTYLDCRRLVKEHAETVRSLFLGVGFASMPFLADDHCTRS